MLNLSLRSLTRVLLIAVVLFNALALNPTAAQAEQDSIAITSLNSQETEQNSFTLPTLEQPEANTTDLKTSTVFMENMGQFDSRARFQVQSGNSTLYFSEDSIWLTLLEPMESKIRLNQEMFRASSPQSTPEITPQKGVNIKIHLIGANSHPEIVPFGNIETNYSFFGESSQNDGYVDVPVWQGIRYKDIYPGLDLEITSNADLFKWQFIVTDPGIFYDNNNQILRQGIRIQISGQQKLGLKDNLTEITTEVGSILLPEFRFNGQTVSPELKNDDLIIPIPEYETSLDMVKTVAYFQTNDADTVTDPVARVMAQVENPQNISTFNPDDALLYSTYLGGAVPISSPYPNNYANDAGTNMAVMGDYVYITGMSVSSDFPNAAGTFTVKFGETANARAYSPYRPFIAKLNIVTNTMEYVDYFNLGGFCTLNNVIYLGSGQLLTIKVDDMGNAYVGGSIVNFNFPLSTNAIDRVIDEGCVITQNSNVSTLEGFLTKIDPTGTQLLYSSYFGGSRGDEITSIEIDQNGNVYAVGRTLSTDMPANGTVYDSTHNGGKDIFVTEINTIFGQQNYFSYLGGNTTDDPFGTTLSPDGSLYITGRTWSNNFSGTTPGSSNTCSTCMSDGFVLKMNPSGTLGYSKYMGGASGDIVTSIAVDPNDHSFVAGYTNSTSFPTTTTKTDTDVFVAELSTVGSILYARRFGGSAEEGYYSFDSDYGGAVALDGDGNIYVTGVTLSTDFPITPNAYDQVRDQSSANQDLFITKIDPDTDQILYSTYLGGSSHEITNENIVVDDQYHLYLLVNLTQSSNFPTRNAYDSTYNGDFDMALAKLSTNMPSYSCTTDIFEPDNSSSTGATLIMGEDPMRHSLCPQNDEDWSNFQVSTTRSVNGNLLAETFDLEPDSITPNGNTQLTVFDASAQNQIGTNQDRGLGPFPGSINVVKSSRVAWHPATGGVFNIKVFPEMSINEQAGSGYSLRLTNPLTLVDPVDQGSWSPTKVNVPFVTRNGDTIYFTQFFTYEQAELDALNAVRGTLAWEFRRPKVDTAGKEIDESNLDYGDYWQSVKGVCAGEYWTNLPSHSDEFVEESNWQSLPGCAPNNPLPFVPKNEEFELYVDDTTQLVAGQVYYITIKFHIHLQYLNNNYQFYVSKVEYCELWKERDVYCNLLPADDIVKLTANLIEGYLQPTP